MQMFAIVAAQIAGRSIVTRPSFDSGRDDAAYAKLVATPAVGLLAVVAGVGDQHLEGVMSKGTFHGASKLAVIHRGPPVDGDTHRRAPDGHGDNPGEETL